MAMSLWIKASYDQNDLIQEFYSIYNQSRWDDVVCPAELGIAESSEQPIYAIINKKGVKLCSTGIEQFYPLFVIGSVCIACSLLVIVFKDAVAPEEEKRLLLLIHLPQKK